MKIIKNILKFEHLNFIKDNKRGFKKIAYIKLGCFDFMCGVNHGGIFAEYEIYSVAYKFHNDELYLFDPLKLIGQNQKGVFTQQEVEDLMIKLQIYSKKNEFFY